MYLNKQEHRKIMLKVLEKISADSFLANNLGFKGGTACYFVHGLDRFSVDLDFDILNQNKEDKIKTAVIELLKKFGTVKTKTSIKLNYNKGQQSLKVDLSNHYKNNSLNTYKIKDIISGVPLQILQKEDIFAHKLIALTSRSASSNDKDKFIANRDLYDLEFFFRNNWNFNEKIIEDQTGKSIVEYLKYAKKFIEKYVDEKNILARLGELVDDEKREWVKTNLKNEVLKYLTIEIESRRE